MLDFNLEYYRAFYYVSKLGSMAKAAKALYISQPAISRSIQELEKHLHVNLFVRKARGVSLTPEGEKLFEYVMAAFDNLISGEQEIQHYQQHVKGTIKIAATETPLYYFLLDKLESFKQSNPHVYFQVSGSASQDTVAMLRNGAADFALAVSPLKAADDMNVITGQTFQDIFVAGTSFTALKERVLKADELVQSPIICVEKGTSARGLIDLWFQEQGIFFEPDYTVRTSTTVLPFVERNLGIGIVPDLFAKKAIEEGSIFQVMSERPLYPREILIIHQKDVPFSLLCEKFLKHLLADC